MLFGGVDGAAWWDIRGGIPRRSGGRRRVRRRVRRGGLRLSLGWPKESIVVLGRPATVETVRRERRPVLAAFGMAFRLAFGCVTVGTTVAVGVAVSWRHAARRRRRVRVRGGQLFRRRTVPAPAVRRRAGRLVVVMATSMAMRAVRRHEPPGERSRLVRGLQSRISVRGGTLPLALFALALHLLPLLALEYGVPPTSGGNPFEMGPVGSNLLVGLRGGWPVVGGWWSRLAIEAERRCPNVGAWSWYCCDPERIYLYVTN